MPRNNNNATYTFPFHSVFCIGFFLVFLVRCGRLMKIIGCRTGQKTKNNVSKLMRLLRNMRQSPKILEHRAKSDDRAKIDGARITKRQTQLIES